jgi:hypothetical protein
MISESAVDSMILALISSNEGLVDDSSLEEVRTVANKPRYCIERRYAYSPTEVRGYHQCDDFAYAS